MSSSSWRTASSCQINQQKTPKHKHKKWRGDTFTLNNRVTLTDYPAALWECSMRITGENSSVMLAWSYFHTCSSSSLAVIILKYFSCLAAGIAWTTWSVTRLSLRMSSSRALMASSLLRGRHKTTGCRLIGVFPPPPHVCLALTQSACQGGMQILLRHHAQDKCPDKKQR